MKRDIDLVRTLLQKISDEAVPGKWYYPDVDGKSQTEINYHLRLLIQAELVTAENLSSKEGESYGVTGLHWNGHEFLDATRSNSVWKKTMDYVKEKGGSMTFEILKSVAVKFAAEAIN